MAKPKPPKPPKPPRKSVRDRVIDRIADAILPANERHDPDAELRDLTGKDGGKS